jgi:hypothetical protein
LFKLIPACPAENLSATRPVGRHHHSEVPMPRYMLVLRGNAQAFAALPADRQRHIVGEHQAWAGSLAEQGALLDGDGFQADTVQLRAGPAGLRAEEAPYKGRDEALSGYYLVQCDTLDAAVALARECPALSHGETVEVLPLGH